MAKSQSGIDITMPAGADLSAKQYLLMKDDGNGNAVVASAATDILTGVLQDDPAASGRAACVRVGGTTKVTVSGALSAGAKIAADANAKGAAAVTTNYVIGVLLEDSAADGDIVEMLITHEGLI